MFCEIMGATHAMRNMVNYSIIHIFLGRGATSIIGSVNPTVCVAVCLCGCVSRLGSMKSEL